MKTLTKFALAAMMLITTLTAQAELVSGHYRSSGTYVARGCNLIRVNG